MKLTFNNYQKYARETAIYKDGIFYPVLGLCGESGEVADKIKKIYRNNNGVISEENKEQLIKEMGDVLWYLSNMAMDLDVTLEDVAKKNLEKIQSRQKRTLFMVKEIIEKTVKDIKDIVIKEQLNLVKK